MPDYVLDHHNEGERQRLALMSRLLDPMHRRQLDRLGVRPGSRTLEVGCGNGSMTAWLAGRVAPGGQAVGVDLDLSLVADRSAADFRQADILAGPVEPAAFDVVTCRAVLHHVGNPGAAMASLVASARPGAAVLVIEPDFLPASVAGPAPVRDFWQGWLAWSRQQGIDYFIGRRLPQMLAQAGLTDIGATAQTALYHGGSPWAEYWRQTIEELREPLAGSGHLSQQAIEKFLGYCADPQWWTQTIAFTTAHGRKPDA